MHAVVGLGNPGERYRCTRHNVGYLLVDLLRERHRRGRMRAEGPCQVDRFQLDGEDVILVKPRSYMNRSGAALRELYARHELTPSRLLVAHDEMDLELGRVQVKRSGGTAGHQGVESIVRALGTDRFPRIRLGVGRPPDPVDPTDWVLTEFRRSEERGLEQMLEWAAEAAECYLRDGLEAAMNRYNRWPR